MSGKATSGNRTSNRGRKLVLNVPISRKTSERLKILLGSAYSQEDCTRYIEELIEEKWQEWDSRIQADVEHVTSAGWEV